MRLLERLLLPALLLATSVAAKSSPEVKKTEFKTRPRDLFYFDDSEVVLVTEPDAGILWRSTDAGSTWKEVDEVQGKMLWVSRHPYDNDIAVAIGKGYEHWITDDKGESWRSFKAGAATSIGLPVSFNAQDSKKMMFHGDDICLGYACLGTTWYTDDAFKTIHGLVDDRKMCIWATGTDLFGTGLDKEQEVNSDTILCIVSGRYSQSSSEYRLMISDDFFKTATEPPLEGGRTVQGVTNMAAVKRFIVAAAKSEGSDELALYVTQDTNTWHRAVFGDHKLEEDAYTILESTNYSVQVDVMTEKWSSMGSLYTSNSNGTYFTRNIDHTNRGQGGYVDFEKISNIQGIVLVNVVDNWEEVENSWLADKEIKTKISFDDGRTWEPLKTGKHDLHLHSVTDQRNTGRIFSSPAPGIIMGVGNTGKYLKPYTQGDLYVSDDAGLTWTKAIDEAHIYEFGDQGAVLAAVYDEGKTNELKYSTNHGKDWDAVKLDDKIVAYELTTMPDSTALKFNLVGTPDRGESWIIYSIDMEPLGLKDCKEKDFETWHARVDEDNKPICIMGRDQTYRRRKKDAECFVDQEFKDPIPDFESCVCTENDFECDYNFVKDDNGKCVPAGVLQPPSGACKNADDKYEGSSGYRLIPGNACTRKGGPDLDKPIERDCSDSVKPPASGDITPTPFTFKADQVAEYFYLERSKVAKDDKSDETVIMRTTDNDVYITHDHGKTWRLAVDEKISRIYPNTYFTDHVYMITPTAKVYYSHDRGLEGSIHSFKAPEAPNGEMLQILTFHPKEKDWLIWTGEKGGMDEGYAVAHISRKGGLNWKSLLPFVRKCQFVWREDRADSEELIYCEQYAKEDVSNPLQLIATNDDFEHKTVHYEDVVNFATMSEFIVIAKRDEKDRKYLKVDASIDGKTFAPAEFPHGFNVEHQTAYTVLDSSTHAIFLHVTVNDAEGQEYGSIIKSNSNGTSYVLSASNVNRNANGFVDYEKMQGIEGVAMVNIVSNVDSINSGKKLKTMITHNDGSQWALMTPPTKDSEDKPYECNGKGLDQCSLHLHGYTERADPRDTFSSPTAVGVMMGVGNVGETLGRYKDGDTYITVDGGVSWKEVMKGTYMWEYGDQGSIIVIVEENTPTKFVYYTTDDGETWTKYQFNDEEMLIGAISTVPSDTSKNFLLWGKEAGKRSRLTTVNLDFSQIFDRECNLMEEDPRNEKSDYSLWSPQHPTKDDDCLFGHVSEYHRKKPESKCFNGRIIDRLHGIARNCTCSREDFEWYDFS